MLNDKKGAIAPLCISLLIVLALAGFGIWGLLRAWRFKVETQFRLDRQVALESLSIKHSVELAEASNQRMSVIRDAALSGAAALTPSALAAIRAELAIEKTLQEGIRIEWDTEQARWMTLQPGARMKLASWQRLPDDGIGAQPYTWTDSSFVLGVRSGSRAAAANIGDNGSAWHAQWTNFY